jgi:transposase
MIKNQRRKFTDEFKSKVAMEAISEVQTLSELSNKYDVHRNQILSWKKEFLDKANRIFESEESVENKSELINELSKKK